MSSFAKPEKNIIETFCGYLARQIFPGLIRSLDHYTLVEVDADE
ncbi:hypothetical protein PM076_16080 [Halorubrum ezzemoulense]|jgi:hypothetical protein|nr:MULTISPECIES: hypothetical protein [Halorubrum]MDB2242780.1 hypothetical protein [Halorubrum ezzemoulense]MDB2246233.1 hypothetical protein [Halorubrum ezzemoulense]MDB2262135.1 hypothetical protein [Halorubrum ezzemoulense]MDB2268838.1 hypothetical protein [Halorubrum ezzemoulense]MDB2287124.1 hypothetical protein [Halorubrum ezzemoulense]